MKNSKNWIELSDGRMAHITRNRIIIFNADGVELSHLVLSVGNNKIGKITNWSIMAGETCAAHCMDTCAKKCYDKRSYWRTSVRLARRANTDAVTSDIATVAIVLDYYLSLYTPEFFRIHVGGDFFSTEYFEMWCGLAAAHPATRFLAYTKQYDVIRYAMFTDGVQVPDNFALFVSLWQGIAEPWDLMRVLPTAAMFDGGAVYDEKAAVCPGSCKDCHHCYSGESVVFVYHGSDVSKSRHDALMRDAGMLFKGAIRAL